MVLILLLSKCWSSILGIDIGNKYIKASIATQNSQIHWALNMDGKRYLPNKFTFFNTSKTSNFSSTDSWDLKNVDEFDWDIGFRADDICQKFPQTCIIGNTYDDRYFNLNGYEIMALKLRKLVASIALAENVTDILEVTIAIQPGLDDKFKSLLYLACNLAKINVKQFIDASVAPAYHYIYEHSKLLKNTSRNIAFLNIGSSGSFISIFNINGSQENRSLTQLSVAYNNSLGGDLIDERLSERIANLYNLSFTTISEKIEFINLISAAKESLSLYPSVVLKWDVDYLEEPIDIHVFREDIINISHEFNVSLIKMVNEALKKAKLAHVDKVEVIGGGTRAIFIRDIMHKALGVKRFSLHLNQDSTIAIGAGYAAAEHSPMFITPNITKKFLLTSNSYFLKDRKTYPIFRIGDEEGISSSVLFKYYPNSSLEIISGEMLKEFSKFKLLNVTGQCDVEVKFTHNMFLMPIPYVAKTNNRELDIEFIKSYWEPKNVSNSVYIVDQIENSTISRLEKQKLANKIEEFLINLKHELNSDDVLSKFSSDNINMFHKDIDNDIEYLYNISNVNLEIYKSFYIDVKDKYKSLYDITSVSKTNLISKINKYINKINKEETSKSDETEMLLKEADLSLKKQKESSSLRELLSKLKIHYSKTINTKEEPLALSL